MIKQVIVVRKDLNMRKGKMCAQVAHASMKVLLDECMRKLELKDGSIIREMEYGPGGYLYEWLEGAFTKIVVGCDSEAELVRLCTQAQQKNIPHALIIDNGTTEFGGVKTATCAAFGPYEATTIDEITGGLSLL